MTTNEDVLRTESQTSLIYSLAIIFVTLSTISVVLRVYTRSHLLCVFGADDVTITIAQVLAIAVSVTTVLEAVWGLGRHTQFVPLEDGPRQLKSLYANILIYNAAQILTKISFLIQYRRLFPSKKIQHICFWLLLGITAWGLTQEFIVGFSCIPLTAFIPSMTGKCIYTLPVWYLTSSMNIVTDFMTFIIPIVPVVKLQMHIRQKLLLLSLFCLGFFTCVISLVRLSTLHKGINTKDPFWDNAPAAYWSVVELNCGILCACLPTLRPLIQRVVPHLLSTYRGSSRSISNMSHRLSSLHTKRSRGEDLENGIYVRKEIELHSSTELHADIAEGRPSSIEDTRSQITSITAESKV